MQKSNVDRIDRSDTLMKNGLSGYIIVEIAVLVSTEWVAVPTLQGVIHQSGPSFEWLRCGDDDRAARERLSTQRDGE